MNDDERAQIASLHKSLRDWAIGDVQRAFDGGAKIGAFILAAHVIDTVAGLIKAKGTGKDPWTQFIDAYMPRYSGHAKLLEDGFRNATSHNYSARGIRFVDGPDYAPRHWTVERGERVLHYESFFADLQAAYGTFEANVAADAALRRRVLERARLNPPLAIVHDPLPESLALEARLLGSGATAWTGSMSASASSSQTFTRIEPTVPSGTPAVPPARPRMDMPKKRRPKSPD